MRTRAEGVKKSDNFADIISGSSLMWGVVRRDAEKKIYSFFAFARAGLACFSRRRVQPGQKRPSAKTLTATLGPANGSPATVLCEGSRFERGTEYDVGVVLSTTGRILNRAR